jgi:hypothetical protein
MVIRDKQKSFKFRMCSVSRRLKEMYGVPFEMKFDLKKMVIR